MSTAPITLYLKMEEGDSPNAKVAAEAILAWDALVKSLASEIFPELGEISLELVTTTVGSKKFNTLIRAVLAGDRKALLSLAGGIILFLAAAPVLHAQTDIGNEVLTLLGHHDYAEISNEDKADIANRVVQALSRSGPNVQKRRLYSVLSRDNRILGVGGSLQPDSVPSFIVPQSAFSEYAGEDGAANASALFYRTRTEENYPVVLIRPILRDGEPMWRFQHGSDPEFSAKMADAEFMEALRERRTGMEMGIGLTMRIDVQFRDEKIGEAWEQKDAIVKRVVFPAIQRKQGNLGFSGGNQ